MKKKKKVVLSNTNLRWFMRKNQASNCANFYKFPKNYYIFCVCESVELSLINLEIRELCFGSFYDLYTGRVVPENKCPFLKLYKYASSYQNSLLLDYFLNIK